MSSGGFLEWRDFLQCLILWVVLSVQGGFVWLFFGSKSLPKDERPPIPFVEELEDPSWKPVYGEIEFECNHWSVFENAIDMAHIHYLHDDTFGNQVWPAFLLHKWPCQQDVMLRVQRFCVAFFNCNPAAGWPFQ